MTFPNDGITYKPLTPYHAELQKKKELYSLPAVDGATANVSEGKHAGKYVSRDGKWRTEAEDDEYYAHTYGGFTTVGT